jgi:5'-3' exonuclease
LIFAGVALLPFVDEKRLLDALATVYPDVAVDESELLKVRYC